MINRGAAVSGAGSRRRPGRDRNRGAPPRLARGFALLVALIMLTAMGLAAAALTRAIDAATAVTGSLALRDGAVAAANAAIEDAIAALFEARTIADPDRDLVAQSYYAARQPGEDARGVPAALLGTDGYPANARVLDAGNGNTLRYVIERMCLHAGAADAANCALLPLAPPPESAPADAEVVVPPVPFFRITARVDGPQGTAVHVQAMVRASMPPRRLSWRLVGE